VDLSVEVRYPALRLIPTTPLSSALAASAAQASCGDRPGTPNELKAEPLADAPTPTIRFSWRNSCASNSSQIA
jgi:hypothetical protein